MSPFCFTQSFFSNGLMADCTELAEERLYFRMKADDMMPLAFPSLAIAWNTIFYSVARRDNKSLQLPSCDWLISLKAASNLSMLQNPLCAVKAKSSFINILHFTAKIIILFIIKGKKGKRCAACHQYSRTSKRARFYTITNRQAIRLLIVRHYDY